MPLEPGSKGLR